jgi:hypothetical protein
MEIGLIIRGECLVCDKKFIARYKGVFEIAVAVGEKTREVKMLGIICKRCMREHPDIKHESLKKHFGGVKLH